MQHRQVALLACTGNHSTPLIRVKEDFTAVVVSGLEEGGEVHLRSEGGHHTSVFSGGLTPFPKFTATRFSLSKVAGPSPRPTSVEIIRGT